KVMVVAPHYTSLTCPKCGHTEKANRNKRTHTFCCRTCGYTSNDDRIGAMNLQRKGIEYIVEGTTQA
ncbi:zinc ribbon domain-containing protein, partial [Geobacillus kaustophilus]|nr:zinc ribbon domain-containing protein [Geobacillus kaustophilus]